MSANVRATRGTAQTDAARGATDNTWEPAFRLAWDANCAVGESCVWDARRRVVWFADCTAGRLFAYAVDHGMRWRFVLPDLIGSIGLCTDGQLVVALRDRVVLFDPPSSAIEHLANIPMPEPSVRLNDGKVGPDRCFWVGSTDTRTPKQPVGSLYRVCPDGRVEQKIDGLRCSNGLAWSPDGRILCHSDSQGPWIDAWDFDASSGRIANRRRLATLSEETGRPDGAAFDEAGCYWSAGVSAGCLNCFSVEGKLIRTVHVPVSAPTMPCFTDTALFVTSLWAGMTPECLAGDPFAGGLIFAPSPMGGASIHTFGK